MNKIVLGMFALLPVVVNAGGEYGGIGGSQTAYGKNAADAFGRSSGNGYAFNAAGSSTTVAGYVNGSTKREMIRSPLGGKVSAVRYSGSVGDLKQVETWAVSNNIGNVRGLARSSGSAQGFGRINGFVRDLELQRCITWGAKSHAGGYFKNSVAANSFAHDTDRSDAGVELSEHGALSGAEINIDGYAGVSGTRAVAHDSKDITTQASTFASGRGSSNAYAGGRVFGGVFESTRTGRKPGA